MKPTQVHPTPTSDQSSVQSSPSQVEPTLNVDNDKHDGLTTPEKRKISVFRCRSRLNRSSRKEGG